MAGNHRSGRKKSKDTNTSRSKKYTFYVKEYAQTNGNGDIVKWVEDSYFQWFRRHHGAEWQEKVRAFMRYDVAKWREKSWWRCKCEPIGVIGNWRHNQRPHCRLCGDYRTQHDRVADMGPEEKKQYYEELKRQMGLE